MPAASDEGPPYGPRGDRQDPPGPAREIVAVELPGGVLQHRVRFWIVDDGPTATPRDVHGREGRWYRLSSTPTGGAVLGLEEIHLRADGVWCGGYVSFDPELCARYEIRHTGHQLISLDPLHVEASLGCRSCPCHGWIRDGRWVDA